MSSSILSNARIGTISNSSFNIGPSSEQLAREKLSAAAAHSALHDAPARTDETRCHKHTRVNVLDHLEHWAEGMLEDDAPLFWLYGGAGAGKSAVMQTLSERCTAKGIALGSFFFSRNDPTRNNAMVLIPTLVYQVAQIFPDALQVLYPLINHDTLIFKKSLQVQLMDLLVQPLQHLVQLGKISDTPNSARVFLIDGLDECEDPKQQQHIIKAVATVCHEHHIPVKFLIASRPELPISTSFRSYKQSSRPLGSISLSEDPDSETDIQRFIEDEFVKICLDHPFNEFIPTEWPHVDDINKLVRKSSSHFIYASTTMKYIWSAKDNPARSLQVLLGLEVSRTGSPFAELDALYNHIFQSLGHLDKIQQILAHCLFSDMPSYVTFICIMNEYSPNDVDIFMADMTPLINVSPPSRDIGMIGQREVKLLHASLGDFLCDPARSGSLYLDKHLHLASKFERCIQLFGLYSQGQTTEPMWPSPRHDMPDIQYWKLLNQISATIRLCGHLDTVGDVLNKISLCYLYEDAQRMNLGNDKRDAWILDILLAIYASETPTSLSKRYMKEFLAILQSVINPQRTPFAFVVLPLIFLGYPTWKMRAISHLYEGTPFDVLMRTRIFPKNEPSLELFAKVAKCIASSDPSIRPQRANLSPEQLVTAILDYFATQPANSYYPDRKYSRFCTRQRTEDLVDVLEWLLPKAGFSEEIINFSRTISPLCDPSRVYRLQKCLDEYNTRVQNDSVNFENNTCQFRPTFDSEQSQLGSVAHMRAWEQENELRTLSLGVADPLCNRNSPQEGNTRTQQQGRGVQERLHAAAPHDRERERERKEIRALRKQHAAEMKALLSQLEDSQRVNNILKEENRRLRDGLDRVVNSMREIESLKQACAKLEMEQPTTRD